MSGIEEMIDRAVEDCAVSGDAMRWRPDDARRERLEACGWQFREPRPLFSPGSRVKIYFPDGSTYEGVVGDHDGTVPGRPT